MRDTLRYRILMLALAATVAGGPAFAQTVTSTPVAPRFGPADGEREARVTGKLSPGSFFFQLHPATGDCLSFVVPQSRLPEMMKLTDTQVTLRARAVSYDYFFKSGRYTHLMAEWGPAYTAPEPDWMNMAGCGQIAVDWQIEK